MIQRSLHLQVYPCTRDFEFERKIHIGIFLCTEEFGFFDLPINVFLDGKFGINYQRHLEVVQKSEAYGVLWKIESVKIV